MASFSDAAFDGPNAFAVIAFDFGTPPVTLLKSGWFSLHDVLHEAEFLRLMKTEAEGAGVWCKWSAGVNLPGTQKVPKNNGNLDLVFSVFRVAATGATTWARFSPGTVSNVRGDIQVNMQAAEAASFALA